MNRIPPTEMPDARTGFDRSLAVLVVTDEPETAAHVEAALEREGFGATAMRARLAAVLQQPSPRCDVAIVVEPEDRPHRDADLAALADALPAARLVVVCAPSRPNPAWLVWRGVDGVIVEPGGVDLVGPIVRTVLNGYVAVPRGARGSIAAPDLSARERRLLSLAADGLTNRQIADRLFLAESTVKRHLSSAFKRLGVKSRREAAAVVRSLEPSARDPDER